MSNTSSFWFQGEAAPNGPTIGQSLRFRGGQNLKRTFGANGSGIKTVSFWIKKNTDSTSVTHLFTGGSLWSVELDTAAGDMDGVPNGIGIYDGTGHDMGTGSYRDPSAWYHVVATTESTSARIWVNGKLMYDAGRNQQLFNEITIGSYYDDTFYYEGYMAAVYFIDGQALEPNAFGEFDENDVWVPREVSFAYGQTRYSDMVTSSSGAFYSGQSPENMFDGSEATITQSSTSDGVVTFTPQPEITFTTGLRVFAQRDAVNEYSLNGGPWTSYGTDGTAEYFPVVTGAGTLTSIAFRGNYGGSVGEIEVDSAPLINPYLWSQYLSTNNPGGFQEPATNAFNGVTTDPACLSGNTGGTLTWAPPSFEVKEKIEVFCKAGLTSASYIAAWNGNEVNYVHDTWATVYEGVGVIDSSYPLTITADPNDQAALAAVRIDGSVVANGVNASFGVNGFHLDFSDPNDLGVDRSGNGNDFTATGFNTQLPGVWSQQLFTSTKSAIDFTSTNTAFAGGAGPEFAFDGVDNFATNPAATSDTSLIFRPNVPLDNVTEIRVNNGGPTGNAGNENGFNGANVTPVAADGGWMTLYSGPPITVNNIFTQSDNRCFISGISINGQVLVDNTGEDYDLMQDSPTQNYATLNSINVDKESGVLTRPVLSKANLQATFDSTNTSCSAYPTIQVRLDDTNKYYFEMYAVDAASTTYPALYFNKDSRTGPNITSNLYFYQQVNGVIVYGNGRPNATGETWSTDDVVGVTIDLPNDSVTIQVNGGASNTVDLQSLSDDEYIVPNLNITQDRIAAFNGGQQPFLYQPAGTVALQTQNLPAAPIPNGRDHFQAITGPGFTSNPPAGTIPAGVTFTGTANSSFPFLQGFNGDESNYTYAADGATCTATFDPPIAGNSFRMLLNIYGSTPFLVNGVDQGLGKVSSVYADISVSGNELRTLQWSSDGAGNNDGFAAVQVDQGSGFQTVFAAGILNVAQQTFPQGLWWIKSRVNPDGQVNQHQISSSVMPTDSWGHCPGNFNAFETYQTPQSNSVAWCWGGTEVTGADLTAVNANGDLPLTALLHNVEAGMSTGYYNGSPDGTTQAPGTQLTFPHGLSQAPEFVVASLMDDNGAGSTNTWQAYHSAPATRAQRSLILRSTDSGFDPDTFWTTEQEATTDTLVRVRVAPSALIGNDVNRRRTCGYDSNYFFMAFHSVPGYSAFGSYTGNGSTTDGPFIYTGMRVGWLMWKAVDRTGNWQIYDSTRTPNNPNGAWLEANETAQEQSGNASYNLDLLSNGFKLRGNATFMNENGMNYIYAAFAENPFSISNAR